MATGAEPAASADVPEEVAGADWLMMQGVRHIVRRAELEEDPEEYKISASVAGNWKEELGERIKSYGAQTIARPSTEGATPLQKNLRDHKISSARMTAFEPNQMVYYLKGRPVVVCRKPETLLVASQDMNATRMLLYASAPPPGSFLSPERMGLPPGFIIRTYRKGAPESVSSQALVISHELAAVSNESCQLAHDLFPLPLYCIQGRSAKAVPQCNPHHCLWYTWKDRLHGTTEQTYQQSPKDGAVTRDHETFKS